MERTEAIQRINQLIGSDLRKLADRYEITVWKGDKINKGWVGHVIERYLCLELNPSPSPDFGSWELKVVPIKQNSIGEFVTKETMAITMINHLEVAKTNFEDSHLFNKLRKTFFCLHIHLK